MEINYLEMTKSVIEATEVKGEVFNVKPFGEGLINSTFLIETKENDEVNRYILQKINKNIFKNVEKLMENYCKICDYLKKVVSDRGGDITRETITVVPAKDGKSYVQDSEGEYWRTIEFIKDTITYQTISSAEDFYKAGNSFGKFQEMLSGYSADDLYETIPNFHNTKERFKTFLKAVEENKSGRKNKVMQEINFILDRKDEISLIVDKLESGELPLRVTHNDTKISNILMDKNTKQGICVIDLDTVMPGSSLYDFGDAIRSGATYAREDEADLTKVYLAVELFEAFAKGFIEGTNNRLEEVEIDMLPIGAKTIILEQGMRFLTDYLDGDLYYKITYGEHNLVRTRTQLKLVKDLENKWEEVNRIVKACKERIS